MTEEEAYDQLTAWSLGLSRKGFTHQLVVDCWTLQQADPRTKPIAVFFALVTLFLHVEKGFSGLQAQAVHLQLARHKETWPRFVLPESRGSIRANDVLAAAEGPDRLALVEAWCAELWSCYGETQRVVAEFLTRRGIGR